MSASLKSEMMSCEAAAVIEERNVGANTDYLNLKGQNKFELRAAINSQGVQR